MHRPWADTGLAHPACGRHGSHTVPGTSGSGWKSLLWTPLCWECYIYFHKVTWEWFICLQWRNIVYFCTIHVFLPRYQGFSPTLFHNCPPTPLPLAVISVRLRGDGWMFLPPWFLKQLGLQQRTEAFGEMDVIIVAALSQSTMWILWP